MPTETQPQVACDIKDIALADLGKRRTEWAFQSMPVLQSIRKQPYTPAAGADYPRAPLGESLKQIAQLIKADVGMEMAFADIGGWDHHFNEVAQKSSEGQLANLLRTFGQALTAFWTDMGDRMQDIALVTMS